MKHLKIAAAADGGIVIEGYGVPFGGPIKGRDLHGQYFSKKTDFALDLIPDGQRPLLYQHGLDSAVDTAVIGRWGVKRIDDGGVWVRAQLDARSEYINEIKELVDNDALGFSSGTMGHLVKVAPKTGEILKWALVELSLTPNPANPNAYIVRTNKSAAAHVKSLFATKHGDHDQSEHGNWAHGGSPTAGSERAARTMVEEAEHSGQEARAEAKQGIDKAYEKSGLSRPGYVAALPEPGMTDKQAFDHGYKEGLAKPTLSYQEDRIRTTGELMQALGLWKAINEKDPLGGQGGDMHGREWLSATAATSAESDRAAADIHEDNNWHNSAAVLRAIAAGKEWLETHDYGKKSLKVKRSTKHGDHDQSEHGNWAHGGGNDKGGNSERDKHDPKLSSGAWHGMQNIAVDATNIQKYTSTVGDFAREMALDMTGDGNSNAAAAWEQVARHAMDIGGTAYTVEESVRENPHGESARQVVNSIDQNAQTMDQSRIVLREAIRVAQATSNSTLPEEVSNALFKLDSSVTAVRYNSGFITQQQSSEFGPKTFRVKRSVKHGDHDQSEHGNWAHSDGGARASDQAEMNRRSDPAYQEKFGNNSRFDGGPKTEKAANNLISFAERAGIDSNQTDAMRSGFEKVQQLKQEGNHKQAETVAANIRDRGAMYLRQADVAEKHGNISDDFGVSRSSTELRQLGNMWMTLAGHAWDVAYANAGHAWDTAEFNR